MQHLLVLILCSKLSEIWQIFKRKSLQGTTIFVQQFLLQILLQNFLWYQANQRFFLWPELHWTLLYPKRTIRTIDVNSEWPRQKKNFLAVNRKKESGQHFSWSLIVGLGKKGYGSGRVFIGVVGYLGVAILTKTWHQKLFYLSLGKAAVHWTGVLIGRIMIGWRHKDSWNIGSAVLGKTRLPRKKMVGLRARDPPQKENVPLPRFFTKMLWSFFHFLLTHINLLDGIQCSLFRHIFRTPSPAGHWTKSVLVANKAEFIIKKDVKVPLGQIIEIGNRKDNWHGFWIMQYIIIWHSMDCVTKVYFIFLNPQRLLKTERKIGQLQRR